MAGKQIKLIFLSDTHLGFDYPIRPRIVRRRRGYDFFANFKRVLSYAIRSKADLIVHGGDFFFRSRVPKKIVDLAYDLLLNFANFDIPIYLVPGNHERSRLPSAEQLSHSNIHIFDRPRSFLFDGKVKVQLSGFPYYTDHIRKNMGRVVRETGWDRIPADFRILCMHHLIEGATIGPSNYMFRRGTDVIRVVDLPIEFPLILSGHIHRRQLLVKNREKGENSQIVVFSGSTERTSFAEKDEPKGFFEFIIRKKPAGQVKIQNFQFVALPARPMVDLTLRNCLNPQGLKNQIRSSINQIDQDAIVRLKIAETLNSEMVEWLTHPFLREIFPGTMNFQLSRNLFSLD